MYRKYNNYMVLIVFTIFFKATAGVGAVGEHRHTNLKDESVLRNHYPRRRFRGEIPYIGYLEDVSSVRLYESWICSGTLITPWFLVSSAACVFDVEDMDFVLGCQKYGCHIGDLRRGVAKKCVPREYEFGHTDVKKWARHDIAVLELASPIDPEVLKTNNIFIRFAKLPSFHNDSTSGTFVKMAGWGGTEGHAMRIMETVILTDELCQEYLPEGDRMSLNGTLCTMSGVPGNCAEPDDPFYNINSTFCQNDHGSPLIDSNDDILLGVMTVAIRNPDTCTGPYYYTNVYSHLQFILCTIENGVTPMTSAKRELPDYYMNSPIQKQRRVNRMREMMRTIAPRPIEIDANSH